MLAYAAQGLPNEDGSVSGSQIRDFLRKCDAALTGLGEAVTDCCPTARHAVDGALRRVHQRGRR